jgi:hypothetical protein
MLISQYVRFPGRRNNYLNTNRVHFKISLQKSDHHREYLITQKTFGFPAPPPKKRLIVSHKSLIKTSKSEILKLTFQEHWSIQQKVTEALT